jgi:hypothetical protein
MPKLKRVAARMGMRSLGVATILSKERGLAFMTGTVMPLVEERRPMAAWVRTSMKTRGQWACWGMS